MKRCVWLNLTYLPVGNACFSFPKNPAFKEKWIHATGRKDWFPTSYSTICSTHFSENDFIVTYKRRYLNSSAIPHKSICILSSSNLTPVVEQSSETQLPQNDEFKLSSEEGTSDSSDDTKLMVVEEPNKQEAIVLPSCSNASTSRKRELKNIIQNKESVIQQQRSKIRKLQAQNRRLKMKVTKVEDILNDLQQKLWLRNKEISTLKNMNLQVQELMASYTDTEESGITRAPYPPALRSFAFTLHNYSPKAYEYVRQTFNTCLPHAITLRKWYSSVDGDPGFTSESFAALKAKAESTNYNILAALTIDEMAIKKRIEWDGEKVHGCVEFGTSTENDLLTEAKEVLVFLVTAINANFKIPVAYFLVDGVTGAQRAELVTQCLERVHETGIQIVSLTFDGCASNVAMLNQLGCSFANRNIQFEHPITKNPVVAILDASHMVKLIRNTFQSYNTIIDKEGNKIKWAYLEELNKIQETKKLHLAIKLRQLDNNQKMKVELATQLFSASVADALIFCEQLKLPNFVNSGPTAFFIITINNLFDIFNSRSMFQYGFKKPMNEKNASDLLSYMDSAIEYLSCLKAEDGTPLVEAPRKTGFLGFIACAESIKILYARLIQTKVLVYLPYYKLSQDHLELMFCNIRSHGGSNNNPTARQFKAAYKKLLVHVDLKNFGHGNCTALEHMSFLNCSSPITRINATTNNALDRVDGTEDTVNTLEEDNEEEAISLLSQNVTEFSNEVINYISENVVRVLEKKINCEDCIGSLQSEPDFEKRNFKITKDKVGLIYPSKDVIKICKTAESVVRSFIDNSVKVNKDILISKIMRNLIGCSLFTGYPSHGLGAYPTACHVDDLKKSIIEKYINIRLHFLIKTGKSKLTKRQLLNKYIIFKGQ